MEFLPHFGHSSEEDRFKTGDDIADWGSNDGEPAWPTTLSSCLTFFDESIGKSSGKLWSSSVVLQFACTIADGSRSYINLTARRFAANASISTREPALLSGHEAM